ncbi:MAG: divalent-cation tolerance protein CutA [Terriglobia bacterium]
MTDKIVVLVTAGSAREATKIASHLVESRLAACVNISAPVRSLYRWQGKIKDDREFLLFIKTRKNRFREVKDAVLKIHSYTTPEIIALPVIEGSAAYLRWIDESVTKPALKRSANTPHPARGVYPERSRRARHPLPFGAREQIN